MESKKHFLFVKGGAFVQKPEDPESSLRQITGHLVDITFKTGDTGSFFTLHIVNQEHFYMLSMFSGSRAGHAFLMLAPSLMFNCPMTLKITLKDGKDFLSINQMGNRLEWYMNFPGYGGCLPKVGSERLLVTLNYAKAEVLPLIHEQPNPYPQHAIYKPPLRRRLQAANVMLPKIMFK